MKRHLSNRENPTVLSQERGVVQNLWQLCCVVLAGWLVAPASADEERQRCEIYQYFVRSEMPAAQSNSGAYLWIPPNTPKIRAVMIGIHNGLPLPILQHPEVRRVCRKHGIAQILFTPNGSEIGSVMLKDLNFDVTDATKTAVYDSYLQRLATLSDHAELLTAPIVPLAHSAYMDFPFDAAMRKPEQCLAAIPIKSGVPDKYHFYATKAKSKDAKADLCLRHVPLLFLSSASQETVGWSAYPHGFGSSAALSFYRRDRDDNPGDQYVPGNELLGECWDMMSGHFDLLPRNYRFVAEWLDAIATARLPANVGEPLRNIPLREGWLIHPQVPATGEVPRDFPLPAPYLKFTGQRAKAAWFPRESLAVRQFEIVRDEPRKKIEMFTFLDPHGKPIELAHGSMAVMPDTQLLPHDDGLLTLTTHRFTEPFGICSTKHGKDKSEPHSLSNLLFPGQTALPVSEIPFQFDTNGAPLELVNSETTRDDRGVLATSFTLRMIRHRLAPDPGFSMFFPRAYHEGDAEFAAAGRTCQIAWVPQDMGREVKPQKVTFPPLADVSLREASIPLHATSSAGLPVDYFVMQGPGIIQKGAFVPMEIPAELQQPITVTIGAYQVGKYQPVGGWRPTKAVYQSFRLLP